MTLRKLTEKDFHYPALLSERLGETAPAQMSVLGNLQLLALLKTALFCSAKCPGNAILAAHDEAARFREEGRCIISGFHAPIEKECLSILLRGKQPIIVCPGRAINSTRVPADCAAAFEAGRVLFVSPFVDQPTRVTKESANRRNEFVAALADEAYIPYVSPGGQTERIVAMLKGWGVVVRPDGDGRA